MHLVKEPTVIIQSFEVKRNMFSIFNTGCFLYFLYLIQVALVEV